MAMIAFLKGFSFDNYLMQGFIYDYVRLLEADSVLIMERRPILSTTLTVSELSNYLEKYIIE